MTKSKGLYFSRYCLKRKGEEWIREAIRKGEFVESTL
jgi:hypothetical protein